MRKVFLGIMLITLFSCSSSDSFSLVPLKADKDIIVDTYWKNPDSLQVFMPLCFEIENSSFSKKEITIRIKNDDLNNYKVFDAEGNDLLFGKVSERYVPSLGKKKIYIYSRIIEAKKSIDSAYWYNLSHETVEKNRNILPSNDRKWVNDSLYNKWLKMRAADTIAFSLRDANDMKKVLIKEYILKTGNVNTYTFDDIYEDHLENKKKDSIDNL